MRCLNPRKVGIGLSGRLTFSKKQYNKEFPEFQIPCGKCIECRLENARTWAIRCVHEAQIHPDNIFLTLTYRDENLPDKLYKRDFQLFAKKLRKKITTDFIKQFGKLNWSLCDQQQKKDLLEKIKIGIMYVGEYGDRTKRPHWHAIIFNYAPSDKTYKRSTDTGDQVFTSKTLNDLWANGHTEFGSVTFESAGYVARYSAKKLIHGNDGTHQYDPVPGKSNHQAIGKRWLQKYWRDIFNYGQVILPNGQKSTIPRYYEKWLAKNQPEAFVEWITKTKLEKSKKAEAKAKAEDEAYQSENFKRYETGELTPLTTKAEARKTIMEQKFKQLQEKLKGDI